MQAQAMHPQTSNEGLFWTVLFIIVGFVVLLSGCNYLDGDAWHPKVPAPVVKPHVLVFHAKWCGACPTEVQITKWADEYPGVDLYDVDIDSPEAKTAVEYAHVTSVPRFVMWSHGEKTDTQNRGKFEEWLQAQR